jgi:hypothetical protein
LGAPPAAAEQRHAYECAQRERDQPAHELGRDVPNSGWN